MKVLPTSLDTFLSAYATARLLNGYMYEFKISNGSRFTSPLYLLHVNGTSGCIISEQTHEIATLFSSRPGDGLDTLKFAISYGGTWLCTSTQNKRLIRYYEEAGFEKVIDSDCWYEPGKCVTYLALPEHHDDIVIYTPTGCVKLQEYQTDFNFDAA